MLIVIRSILLKLIGICKANNQSKAADIHQLSPSVFCRCEFVIIC